MSACSLVRRVPCAWLRWPMISSSGTMRMTRVPETIARGLDKRVAGDTVESVWIGSKKQLLKSPADVIALTLEGKRFVRVHRAGKHIVFDLEDRKSTRL